MIPSWDKQALQPIPDLFDVAAHRGHDNRPGGSHRFQESDRCGLTDRAQREHVNGSQDIRHVPSHAEKHDPLLKTRVLHLLFQGLAQRAIAHEQEIDIGQPSCDR